MGATDVQRARDGESEEPIAAVPQMATAFGERPRWLVTTAIVAAGAVLCMGFVGLLLADAGEYTPVLAFGVGALLLVGFIALLVPALAAPSATPRSAHVVAALGVVFIASVCLWNGANHSEHVLINRDAGAYVDAGRWIARNGTLEVRAKAGPFRGQNAPQFPDIGMGRARKVPLELQFHASHLLPALLAEAYALGGDQGMFALPAWLGAIALLEFFVLAWRLFRHPFFALVAVAALAVMLPEVSFARDAYTEIPTQIFVFGALALLVDKRLLPHWRVALGAGLLFGAVQATRVDAPLLLIGLPPLMAIAWLRPNAEDERRHVRLSSMALGLGLLPGCVLGITDLMARSTSYWHSQWPHERWLLVLTGASALASIVLVNVWPHIWPFISTWRWNTIGRASFAVVLVAGLGAWFVRPEFQHLHVSQLNALQEDGRLVLRYTTAKYELSMWWMSWYLGPVTVLSAIVGGAFLARSFLRGRRLYALAPAFVLVPATVLYLWHARAFADHIWVTRRYVDGAFPLLILLALGLATALWRGHVAWARVASVAIVIGAVAFPLYTTFPVRSAREQGNYLAAVHDVCRTIGPHANVAVVESLTSMASPDVREEWLPQTIRSFCGANVGTLYVGTPRADLLALARKVAQRNKTLFLVASGASVITQIAPDARMLKQTQATNKRLLAQTFADAPRSYETQTLPIVIASMPGDAVR